MLLKLLFSFLIVFFSDYSFAESGIAHHPSPYIRMHANDAVKWRVWNQLALNQARKENKLILISVGYFACHWCHVMKKESFENKKIRK